MSFNPNWICRDVVDVHVIAPAVPDVLVPAAEDVKVIRFGVLKFARLSRLKISARNCSDSLSRKVVVLNVEKSHVAKPGPVNVSRPKSPKKPLLAGGAKKAFGSNHCAGFPRMTFP